MEQKKHVVYFVQVGDLIKIGRTSDYPRRMQSLKSSILNDLVELGVLAGGDDLEKKLHVRFSDYRSHGEWFHATPELMLYIKNSAFPYKEGVGEPELSQDTFYEGLTIQQMRLIGMLFEPRPKSVYQKQVKWTVYAALILLIEIYESGALLEEKHAAILELITRNGKLPLLELEYIEEMSLAIVTGLIGFSNVPQECPPKKDAFES